MTPCNTEQFPDFEDIHYNHRAILLQEKYLYVMGGKKTAIQGTMGNIWKDCDFYQDF